MWIDLIVAAVFALSTAQGLRNGFAFSFFHAIGLIASVVLGYFAYPPASDFLRRHTSLHDSIQQWLTMKIGGDGPTRISRFVQDLPAPLQNVLDKAEQTVVQSLANGLTDFMFNILCFLLVVLAIRFLLLLLSAFVSKKHHAGLIGFVDGLFGLVFGAGRGILIVFLLLALLVPILGIIQTDAVANALEASVIAKPLYDNNPIFLLLHDFL